jgi:hypothetical protein
MKYSCYPQCGVLHFVPGGFDAQSGTWIHYKTENGLFSDEITTIALAPRGVLWLGADQYCIARCQVEE